MSNRAYKKCKWTYMPKQNFMRVSPKSHKSVKERVPKKGVFLVVKKYDNITPCKKYIEK